jgi:hypothetical protein
MTWRIANSLLTLRDQVNALHPGRSKDSDGAIGDEHHASRSSDHNPWVMDGATGIVSAIDITHDPAHGFDSYAFAQKLLDSRDARIKYVISNGRIGSGDLGPSPWAWRKYTGINKHDHHVHISVKSDKVHYDDQRLWNFDAVPTSKVADLHPAPPAVAYVKPLPTVRKGDRGEVVRKLQTALGFADKDVDGDFGITTLVALKAAQFTHGLANDGICGPATWAMLKVTGA